MPIATLGRGDLLLILGLDESMVGSLVSQCKVPKQAS